MHQDQQSATSVGKYLGKTCYLCCAPAVYGSVQATEALSTYSEVQHSSVCAPARLEVLDRLPKGTLTQRVRALHGQMGATAAPYPFVPDSIMRVLRPVDSYTEVAPAAGVRDPVGCLGSGGCSGSLPTPNQEQLKGGPPNPCTMRGPSSTPVPCWKLSSLALV